MPRSCAMHPASFMLVLPTLPTGRVPQHAEASAAEAWRPADPKRRGSSGSCDATVRRSARHGRQPRPPLLRRCSTLPAPSGLRRRPARSTPHCYVCVATACSPATCVLPPCCPRRAAPTGMVRGRGGCRTPERCLSARGRTSGDQAWQALLTQHQAPSSMTPALRYVCFSVFKRWQVVLDGAVPGRSSRPSGGKRGGSGCMRGALSRGTHVRPQDSCSLAPRMPCLGSDLPCCRMSPPRQGTEHAVDPHSRQKRRPELKQGSREPSMRAASGSFSAQAQRQSLTIPPRSHQIVGSLSSTSEWRDGLSAHCTAHPPAPERCSPSTGIELLRLCWYASAALELASLKPHERLWTSWGALTSVRLNEPRGAELQQPVQDAAMRLRGHLAASTAPGL
jgi:hypothetical protein